MTNMLVIRVKRHVCEFDSAMHHRQGMTTGRVIVRARRQLAPKFDSRVESGASVADRIYAELKKAIVSGELKPGMPIDKNEMRLRFKANSLLFSRLRTAPREAACPSC